MEIIKKKAFLCFSLALVIAITACAQSVKNDTVYVTDPDPTGPISYYPGTLSSNGESVPMLDFIDNNELYAWYEGLDDNPPISLEHWIYGLAPYSTETDDSRLILHAAKAVATVLIGEKVPEKDSPDHVLDAPGDSYIFKMDDGTNRSFSFILGCYEHNGEWYSVDSFGDLEQIGKSLDKYTEPDMITVMPNDRSFYVFAPSTWSFEDKGSEGFDGGFFIYPYIGYDTPYIVIRQFDESSEAFDSFDDCYREYLANIVENDGSELTASYRYNSGNGLPVTEYTDLASGGNTVKVIYATQILRDRLENNSLIQFAAVCEEQDRAHYNSISDDLADTVLNFTLVHRHYEKHAVKPDNTLLDFLNDDYTRDAFKYMEEYGNVSFNYAEAAPGGGAFWGSSDDKDIYIPVLGALKTVKIGDELDNVPSGNEGWRHFTFSRKNGETIADITFFKDYIRLDTAEHRYYRVTDWGSLDDIGLTVSDNGHGLSIKNGFP